MSYQWKVRFPMSHKSITDRFWSKVKLPLSIGNNQCWNWQASDNKAGYGTFRFNGKICKAHRVAYELSVGPIPKGLDVLHSCDNPPCVNPSHLRPGTHQNNMQDREQRHRGNHACGERQNLAKLTEDQVRYIRTSNKNTVELGKELGVADVTIGNVRKARTWKHVR